MRNNTSTQDDAYASRYSRKFINLLPVPKTHHYSFTFPPSGFVPNHRFSRTRFQSPSIIKISSIILMRLGFSPVVPFYLRFTFCGRSLRGCYTSLKGAFTTQSSINRGRGRGDLILEEEEEVFSEAVTTTILQMSLVEDRIRTQVIQVVTSLINEKSNVIIVINLVIIHINVGRSNMTKEGKSRTS